MSKTLLAAALLAIIGLGACKPADEDDMGRPTNYLEKGALRFKNSSTDLYDIYLDDARYGNLYGGDSSTYPNITVGTHRVKAIQTEHVMGTAILRQQIVIVAKDTVTTFVFP